MQKIFDLHEKKSYGMESLFTAANIFDRFIIKNDLKNLTKPQLVSLTTISVLLSAKLLEPLTPNFTRMMILLTEEEQ